MEVKFRSGRQKAGNYYKMYKSSAYKCIRQTIALAFILASASVLLFNQKPQDAIQNVDVAEKAPVESVQQATQDVIAAEPEVVTMELVTTNLPTDDHIVPDISSATYSEMMEMRKNKNNGTVETEDNSDAIDKSNDKPKSYSDEDLEYLAIAIYSEAGGDMCSDSTRLMVGNVILNRVKDPGFPNTIKEVLTARKQYGRFYWTGIVWPERASKPEEAHAVKRAYSIAKRLLEGERVLYSSVIYQAEFPQGAEIVAYQDGFYFCK